MYPMNVFHLHSGKEIYMNKFPNVKSNYSRLSLSRLRLSRITAYLEEKIWSLFQHRNLTSCTKILWIREEIAPQEQFLSFSTLFSTYISTKGVRLHVHLWNLVVCLVFSSILQIWYVKVRISRSVSEGPFDFEITRVDCIKNTYLIKGLTNQNLIPVQYRASARKCWNSWVFSV